MTGERSTLQIMLLIGITIWNGYTYLLFYIDKKRAINNKRNRISENKLLASSFLAGGIGGLLGMTSIRHKTKHMRFKLLVPLSAFITLLIIYFIWKL